MMLLSDGARGASRAPTRRRRPRAHAPPSPSCMVRMHEMHLRPGHHIWPRALRPPPAAAPTPRAMRVNALEFCWSRVEKQSRETERYSKREWKTYGNEAYGCAHTAQHCTHIRCISH